jgi:hypothetical protein
MYYIVKLHTSGNVVSGFDGHNFTQLDQETIDNIHTGLVQNEDFIINKLNTSLTNCFGNPFNYTKFIELIPSDNIDYYLVFGLVASTNDMHLLFSVSYTFNSEQNRVEIFSVCKTNSEISKDFRVADFLYIVNSNYLTAGIEKIWLGVLFSNTFYERAVVSYLRAGFDVKYVSSLGSQEKSNYNGRFLVMEANAGKGSYAPGIPQPFALSKAEEAKMISIAKNIKLVEYDALQEIEIRLEPSAWKVFLRQVVVKNKECGGIIRKHVDASGNAYIDKFSILMGCEGGVDPSEKECTTNQVFSYEINFHTHPILCYNKLQGVSANLGPPSVADYSVVFNQFMEGLHLFHMVTSLEGIYVVSVHPYWKYLLENNKLSQECLLGMNWLINSISQAYFPDTYFTDISEMLKYSNNLMSPNLLIKRYVTQKGMTAEIQVFKENCLASGINRNINLYICSFIPYPINTPHQQPVLEYIRKLKEHKLRLDQLSLDERVSTVQTFLDTILLDVPITIPYYTINPDMKAHLDQIT